MNSINLEIAETAKQWIGQEEVKGNMGFKDSDFDTLMKAVGHEEGQAWCAYFSELVWKYAYQKWDATLFPRLDKLFSSGAVITFKNFSKTKDFVKSRKPKVGSLIVWQKYKDGKPHWSGHIGIVTKVNGTEVITAEGNTNNNGSREGYIVAEKRRIIDYNTKHNGLVLLGFIHPKEL